MPTDLGSCGSYPPFTKLSYTGGTLGQNGWLISPVVVTLTPFNVSGKGIVYTEYSFDNIHFTSYNSVPLSLPEGNTTIYYRSVDSTGNVEKTKQQTFKLDTLKPTTLMTYTGGTPGKNGWMVSPVTVTLSGKDAGSGLNYSEYTYNGTTWHTYSAPFLLPEGETTLYYRSVDVAGNIEAAKEQSFKIDTLKPVSSTLRQI